MTRNLGLMLGTAVTALAVTACANGNGPGGPLGPTPLPAVPAGLDVALTAAMQDEVELWLTYEGVLRDFGATVQPFATVVEAERQHAANVAVLLDRRGLPMPTPTVTIDTVPRFATLAAACAQAVDEERNNVAMYDTYLAADLPNDVFNVFAHNREASADQHLPAFERCR